MGRWVTHGKLDTPTSWDVNWLVINYYINFTTWNLPFYIFPLLSLTQAYNITNDAPLPFWDFVSSVLTGLDYPPPVYKLPYWLVYSIALLLQFVALILKPLVTFQPTFTPMKVALAGTHHSYSCERAKRDLAYTPVVPFNAGLKKTLEHFSYLRKTWWTETW